MKLNLKTARAWKPAGRQATRGDAAGTTTTTTTTYGAGGVVEQEVTSGIWGLTVDPHNDTASRRDQLNVVLSGTGGFTAPQVVYAYDPVSGQLGSASSGTQHVTFGYDPGLDRWNSLSFKVGTAFATATQVMSASRIADGNGRDSSIAYTSGGVTLQSFVDNYTGYDLTKTTREDTTWWSYAYDGKRQVASGEKMANATTTLSGTKSTDAYDQAGNRTSRTRGGGALSMLTDTYTPNALNQSGRRVEAHIMVAFLGYAMHVCLKKLAARRAPGLTSWQVLQHLRKIVLVDVKFETADGRSITLPRITIPEKEQATLLVQFGWSLPEQPPPRIGTHQVPSA